MFSTGLVTSYAGDMGKNRSSSVYEYTYHKICKSCVNHTAQGLGSGATNFFLTTKTAVLSGWAKNTPRNHKATQTLQLVSSLQRKTWVLFSPYTREASTAETQQAEEPAEPAQPALRLQLSPLLRYPGQPLAR